MLDHIVEFGLDRGHDEDYGVVCEAPQDALRLSVQGHGDDDLIGDHSIGASALDRDEISRFDRM